jgi:hypothetical protein
LAKKTIRRMLAASLLAAAAWAAAACSPQPSGTAGSDGAAELPGAAAPAPAPSVASDRPPAASNEAAAADPAAGEPAGQSAETPPASSPAEASASPAAAQRPSPPRNNPSPASEVSSAPSSASSSAPEASGQTVVRAVTISVAGNSEWGEILESRFVELKDGDTVADLLIRALKASKLAYETSGSGALFYVRGIDGLFEFDDGPTSGWHYRVNGKELGVGAGSYKPEPGDAIEWIYESEDPAARDDKGTGT